MIINDPKFSFYDKENDDVYGPFTIEEIAEGALPLDLFERKLKLKQNLELIIINS